MNNTNILITGVGGQGTILAGKIISAVALAENLDVKTAETHGMAQRGGSVVTHIRYGTKVYSPLIPRGDAGILLAFERLEGLRWLPYLDHKGTAIINTQVLHPLPVLTGQATYPAGIMEEIADKTHRLIAVNAPDFELVKANPRVTNVLLLGILARFLNFTRETWDQVLDKAIPPKLLDLNRQAFDAGWNYKNH